MRRTPDIIKITAKNLRKNQTEAEKILWDNIKDRKQRYKFQRQYCLYLYTEDSGLDRYIIPDFYCSEKKLIIELDGSIHNLKTTYELDQYKTQFLLEQGYQVLRFQNNLIMNDITGVLKIIVASFSGKEREFKSELGLKTGDLRGTLQPDKIRQKRFTMINDSFTCENCKQEITKHPAGSARNHCPLCLHSKHLDKEFPGDRLSDCHSLMKPVGKDYHKNKGWMVIHECIKCNKKIPNKLAEDDSVDVFGKL